MLDPDMFCVVHYCGEEQLQLRIDPTPPISLSPFKHENKLGHVAFPVLEKSSS